jgi:hypothetical protein
LFLKSWSNEELSSAVKDDLMKRNGGKTKDADRTSNFMGRTTTTPHLAVNIPRVAAMFEARYSPPAQLDPICEGCKDPYQILLEPMQLEIKLNVHSVSAQGF